MNEKTCDFRVWAYRDCIKRKGDKIGIVYITPRDNHTIPILLPGVTSPRKQLGIV